MVEITKGGNFGQICRAAGAGLLVVVATMAALEIFLRIADFRELREGVSERSLSYRYDPELGWAPVPSSISSVTNARTVEVVLPALEPVALLARLPVDDSMTRNPRPPDPWL